MFAGAHLQPVKNDPFPADTTRLSNAIWSSTFITFQNERAANSEKTNPRMAQLRKSFS